VLASPAGELALRRATAIGARNVGAWSSLVRYVGSI
jgi:hypothetical protein